MSEKHFVEGTTHVTYLHKNDERRSKFHCKHLRIGNSCPFRGKCIGSAHCFYYEEKEQIHPTKVTAGEFAKQPLVRVTPFSGIKELKLKDILVDNRYLTSTPNPEKVRKLIDYYNEHHELNAPIQVVCAGDKYRLKDKYIRYYVAKQLGLSTIPAIYHVRHRAAFGEGARVLHKKYGIGTVSRSNSLHIHIVFDSGIEKDFEKRICAEQNLLTLYNGSNTSKKNTP